MKFYTATWRVRYTWLMPRRRGGLLLELPEDRLEAVRALTGWGSGLTGRLAIIDMLDRRWREVAVPKDPECPICRG